MDRQRELDKLLRNRQTGSCDNRLKDALAFAGSLRSGGECCGGSE